jgi:HEAT repeat protein
LLYTWDDSAEPALISALADDEWRVREMAAKVVRRRELGASADQLTTLADDEVARVRVAVARALGRVGEGEHAEALLMLAEDPEPNVAGAAASALEELSLRLDRTFRP